MSDFSAESTTAQGGPGPFAPPQDDDARGQAPAQSPPRGPDGSGAPDGPSPGGPAASGPGAFGTGAPAGPAPVAPPANGAPRPVNPAPGSPGAPAGNGGPGGPPTAPPRLAPVVKGRIEVADEVVEKVAALAAIEVEGVADLGGDFERALESVRERIGIGQKRGDQGVKARITGREVLVDVVIMVEYGHVVMDVARQVQANVAVQTNRMLGLHVVEVNVTVDDVKLPEPARPEPPAYDEGQCAPQPDAR